jgi:hypothetical protein
MKFGIQTKREMLSLTITKAEVYGKRTTNFKCKKRYRFKKATFYEREVIKKQTFSIRWQKLPFSYNRRSGNHRLNLLVKSKLWCMRVFQPSSIIEILLHV